MTLLFFFHKVRKIQKNISLKQQVFLHFSLKMNQENFELASKIVNANYINQGKSGRAQREKMVKKLLSNRNLPEEGWDDQSIEFLFSELAAMDSNNFPGEFQEWR